MEKAVKIRMIIVLMVIAAIVVTGCIVSAVNRNGENAVKTSAKPAKKQTLSVVSVESMVQSSSASVSSAALATPAPQAQPAKVCYLTFDDGPSKFTPQILQILTEHSAVATFFVVGTNSRLDFLPNIVAQGSVVGLHTDTHVYASIYSGEDAYFNDLHTVGKKVQQKIGYMPNIIRFPGGSNNLVSSKYSKGLMSTLVKSVSDEGFTYIDWNVSSGDAERNGVPADTICKNVIARSGNMPIICVLMHDTVAKATTVEALPKIIDELKAKGYTFATLSKDSPMFHFEKLNN